MRAFRWGLAFAFLGLVLSVALSGWDKAWLLVAAGLAAFGYDIAHAIEVRFASTYRTWKERRERQRHTQVVSKIDVGVQQILAKLDREALVRVGQATSEEEKDDRMAEWKKNHVAILEIMALYDRASEYGEMADATIRDISKIIAGSVADANQVEVLLGLSLTADPEYHKNMSAQSKVEQVWLRTHLYHKERVEKISKDNLLGLSE